MERLGKLVKRLKEAIELQDVAEIKHITDIEYDYNEFEGRITGLAKISVRVGPITDLRGVSEWPDVEGKAQGILRSLEFQIFPMLQDQEKEADVDGFGEYNPDWEEKGEIEWSRQPPFRLSKDSPVVTEIEVKYSDQVG